MLLARSVIGYVLEDKIEELSSRDQPIAVAVPGA